MNRWGRRSEASRGSSDPRLNEIGDIVLQIKNHSVLKGHRGEAEQNEAYNAVPQRSKLKFPFGKHNGYPSKAQDVRTYPWPEKEQDQREEQLYLLGLYKGVGHMLGYKIRTGADWSRDGNVSDNTWDDLFHAELDE